MGTHLVLALSASKCSVATDIFTAACLRMPSLLSGLFVCWLLLLQFLGSGTERFDLKHHLEAVFLFKRKCGIRWDSFFLHSMGRVDLWEALRADLGQFPGGSPQGHVNENFGAGELGRMDSTDGSRALSTKLRIYSFLWQMQSTCAWCRVCGG